MKARENGALRGVANVSVAVSTKPDPFRSRPCRILRRTSEGRPELVHGHPARSRKTRGRVHRTRTAAEALKAGRRWNSRRGLSWPRILTVTPMSKQQLRARRNPSYPHAPRCRQIHSLKPPHIRRRTSQVLGIWKPVHASGDPRTSGGAPTKTRSQSKFDVGDRRVANRQQAAAAFAGWRDDELARRASAVPQRLDRRLGYRAAPGIDLGGRGRRQRPGGFASLARQLRAADQGGLPPLRFEPRRADLRTPA